MDARDEIKQRLSVEDVVGDYVELKRAGRNLKALSPFTNERTASLMVSPEKQIWHDFSSNQGGDIFSFVMLMDGVDFRGALEILARKAGVDLSEFQRGDGRLTKRKNRAYEALQLAAKYYHASLPKNKSALDYVVKKRGYGKQILQDFMIGYSPKSGTALSNFLKKRKFTQAELKDAGLLSQRGTDMFRGRIMVPLADGQGRIIGFTARVLDDSLPKYINTPQSLVYDKSRNVFGLHLAKEAIRSEKFVVVVEGNLDVIASHKAGVKNVVASAGTAMTKDHLTQLSRLTTDIRLAFDTDRAGLDATERAIPIAQEVDVRLSIVDIPSGKDPDELIKQDPKLWQTAVKKSDYVMDWLINHYQTVYDITAAEGKKRFTDKVLTVLARCKDPVEMEHYQALVADMLHVSPESIRKKMAIASQPTTRKKQRSKAIKSTAKAPEQAASAYQDLLLGLNLLHPDLRRSLKDIQADWFLGHERQKLMKYILDNPVAPMTEVPTDLREIEDYVKIVLFKAEELYDEWSASDRMIEAIGLSRRLIRDNQQKLKQQLSTQIKAAEAAGDDATRERLLKQFDHLLKERS